MESNNEAPNPSFTSNMYSRPNKVQFILFMILAAASIATIGILYHQNDQLKKQISQLQAIPKTFQVSPTTTPFVGGYFFSIKEEFDKFRERYNAEVLEKNDLSLWWVSRDNLDIINDNSRGIAFNLPNCESDIKSKLIFKEAAQQIGQEVEKIMEQNSFGINLKNSSRSIEDEQFYAYIQAYEKGNVRCVFKADPDCGRSLEEKIMHYDFSFACTDEFEKNYQEQTPYLKDLEIKDSIIHIQKQIGDFIKLNINSRRGGAYMIAKLINGKWKKLYYGQDVPSCEIIEKYKVPKEIISDCI